MSNKIFTRFCVAEMGVSGWIGQNPCFSDKKKLVWFKSVCMAEKHCIGGEGHDLFRKGISHKKIPLRMPFAVPISFFKSISIIFGGAGLIFEGLTNPGGCRNGKFCQGLPGANPQRSNQSVLLRNPFGRCSFRNRQGPHSDDLPLPKALRV